MAKFQEIVTKPKRRVNLWVDSDLSTWLYHESKKNGYHSLTKYCVYILKVWKKNIELESKNV
jgi:hypothetical protein